MPITTNNRYFGEGIHSYGIDNPQEALNQHREHVRRQRLNDLLGKDAQLNITQISEQAERIADALSAADTQVKADNAAFIKKHTLTM